MDLDSLSVRQFRYLSTVATHPTFTDAAAELGISQSALSQAMHRIEKLVGVPLFVPDGRMRRLTEVGAVMVARSRQIVGVSAALENEVTAHGHGEVGRLRVGMIDAAAPVPETGFGNQASRPHTPMPRSASLSAPPVGSSIALSNTTWMLPLSWGPCPPSW